MKNIEVKDMQDGITLEEATNIKGGYIKLKPVYVSSYSFGGTN